MKYFKRNTEPYEFELKIVNDIHMITYATGVNGHCEVSFLASADDPGPYYLIVFENPERCYGDYSLSGWIE
jgi:hypothetical protein